ncbi:zinc finger protein PLAGL2-like isoform X1 [Amblyomma americanum]
MWGTATRMRNAMAYYPAAGSPTAQLLVSCRATLLYFDHFAAADGMRDESWPAGGRQYRCPTAGCGRLFSSKFKLLRHALIHGGERPFQCPSCERRFHRKDHLKTHQQVHDPNKALHTCALCGKKYSSALSFRKHSALHAAEAGDPVCRLCGAAFARREDVLLHLKVHSGASSRLVKPPTERRFKCDRCERSFFTRKDVKRHLVVHTGQRNFQCQFCPQKFGRKDHLVRHTKKTHSGQGGATAAAWTAAFAPAPPAAAIASEEPHRPPPPAPQANPTTLLLTASYCGAPSIVAAAPPPPLPHFSQAFQ